MAQSFWQALHAVLARKSLTAVTLCGLCAPAVWAQEVVPALQITPHQITQVVVGAEDGQTYVMSTLQPLSSDVVLVTPAMAQAAKPFSVVHSTFTPVESLSQVPPNRAQEGGKLVLAPGVKEVQAHSFNTVYEVIYQHDGRWMAVETNQAPENGQLMLTDSVKKASRTLWAS